MPTIARGGAGGQNGSGRLEGAKRMLGLVARAAADFFCPPACPLCGTSTVGDQPGSADEFCANCLQALLRSRGPCCLACGASIGPHLDPARKCGMCHQESFAFERVIRLGVYDDALRGAMLRAKDLRGESLCEALGQLVWRQEEPAFRSAEADVVVPVPRDRWRRWLHPHNTAETLANLWGRRLQVDCASHILRKTRWTRLQAELSPSERRVNLRNAFAAAPRVLTGAAVLLADDVMTTGATAHEAARALRSAGARRVVLAVVARGLGRR